MIPVQQYVNIRVFKYDKTQTYGMNEKLTEDKKDLRIQYSEQKR